MEILGTQPLSSADIKILTVLCQKRKAEIVCLISEFGGNLNQLIDLELISTKDNCIELNLKKIKSRYPWILEENVQNIILDKIKSDSEFELEKTAQYVLYLLCKNKDGLTQTEIRDMANKTDDQFKKSREILEELCLIVVKKDGTNNRIVPTFLGKECSEADIIAKESKQVAKSKKAVSTNKQAENIPDYSEMSEEERQAKVKEVEKRMYKEWLAPMFKNLMLILLKSSFLEMDRELLKNQSGLTSAKFNVCINSLKEQNYIIVNRRIGNNVTVK
ncbi:MAG: hypothetical protein KAI57_03085 [Candidatus Pacebacteria bacterium]|nr:hypothetical protein [Candidatus Paceibacterota bacterium]